MNDYIDIWPRLTLFHSTNVAQKFLYHCYVKQERQDAAKKSYANCYPFIYYLEHGQNFYATAKNAPLSIRPVLLFYGMVQLLKACLLTVDAEYPESTLVLAHGVSTRKRKKQSYEFFEDEVKIQKNGLFTHFSEKMFHVKHSSGEKFQMRILLQRIYELHELFSVYYKENLSLDVIYDHLNQNIIIPSKILDHYHMTLSRFKDYITKELCSFVIISIKNESSSPYIHVTLDNTQKLTPLGCEPFLYGIYDRAYRLPTNITEIFKSSEIIAHYLLLYNLSMICRYETEWWNELLHSYSSDAYPFIIKFLSITADKVPFLLHYFLLDKFESLKSI
ncbi:YaaC-like protein [Anoxybacillus vitaminiphilus]|uniref:YaaC-like protein n=1 Tax=Paranoxybacillus vitaminiphilus TaxID=581036 RepID=A0A327Y6X7_9BACL|nr:YaaC family protein [Anoxybacillus vitaminiphilus]RAK14199.1 YaaC-like protein [Anoxybacillus vitaminiphilus]